MTALKVLFYVTSFLGFVGAVWNNGYQLGSTRPVVINVGADSALECECDEDEDDNDLDCDDGDIVLMGDPN
jgi:hypothetical protein